MTFHAISARLAALATVACLFGCAQAPTATGSEGPDESPPPPPSQVTPALVTGRIVDTQGRPIAGARIWVRPALTTGLLQATTDANGRYSVQALPNLPYHAYARGTR